MSRTGGSQLRRRVCRVAIPVATATSLLGLPAATTGVQAATTLAHSATPVPALSGPILVGKQLPAPISTTDCLADFGINCYTPVQYRTAYDLNPLYQRGITGRGRTIVIVDSFGSPTIQNDIKVFDAQFGFPDPNLQVIKFGNVPAFDPTNSDMVGWPRRPPSTWSMRTPSRPARRSSSRRHRSPRLRA
jgi:subtilase family serine protease